MEKKNTIWVVVTWDSESARLMSKMTCNSYEEAANIVGAFYLSAKVDKNVEGAQLDDDRMFACCTINGRDEFCEAFEI